jgi:CHRD domain-containing protein
MKAKKFRTAWLSVIIIASCLGWFASCYKNKSNSYPGSSTNYALSGTASGSQETPSNTTTGTGTLTGSFNSSTNALQYNIVWTGLTGPATAMHFHGPASMGTAADVLVDLNISTNGVSGNGSGTISVNDAFKTALLAGQVYYNIHTALYPNGEIRGQVKATSSGGGSMGGGGGY